MFLNSVQLLKVVFATGTGNSGFAEICAETDHVCSGEFLEVSNAVIISTVYSRSVLDCARRCLKLERCLLYGFDLTTSSCILMNEFTDCSILQMSTYSCSRFFMKTYPSGK